LSAYPEIIIPAQTDGIISIEKGATGGITIVATDTLGDDEAIKVEITADGVTWYDLYLNGVLQEIDSKHSIISLHGPIKFRCVKTATVSAIGVVIWRTEVQ
jgi:hypothetical protein